jgi:hypothetical protein
MLFCVMPATLQSIFRRARLDKENDAFFKKVPPARLRNFYPVMLVVFLFAVLGALLAITEDTYLLALFSLLVAAAAHARQMVLSAQNWRKAMLLD